MTEKNTEQPETSEPEKAEEQNPSFKQAIPALLIIVAVVGLVATVMVTNIRASRREFATVEYTSAQGGKYGLEFYAKHDTRTEKSGNVTLISKTGKYGKLPLTVSIDNAQQGDYDKLKECTGAAKVYDVQITSLNQKVPICDVTAGKKVKSIDASDTVYATAFTKGEGKEKKSHVAIISQDYSGLKLKTESDVAQALPKMGLKPYQEDITRIIGSIQVK